ncbi:MAG: hypothetical protein GY813_20215 [Halieaceae bacterium]|nr:hypothetical protein [Halieaceae bacterium]
MVSGADGRGHRVHAGVERGPLQRQPDQLIGGRDLRDRPSQDDKKPSVMNPAYVHNALADLRIMNEAEDGGAESLASKFEIQRHQFLYRVDTCRSAAERLSSSGCSRRRRRSTGAALPQARPGTAAPKQRHYSPSRLQAPSRHAAASTHSPLTGSSRAEEAIGRGGRRRGGAARVQGR